MAGHEPAFLPDPVVEEVRLTLVELCQASRVPEQEIRAWVIEGVLRPKAAPPISGASPAHRCAGPARPFGFHGISR
jgi:hypothetical protein